MRRWAAAIGLAFVVLGCAGQDRVRATMPGAQLTRQAPSVELALGAPPSASAIVALAIGRTHNPEREAVNLELALTRPAFPQQPITLGSVSLFPNDQPARFLVRASKQLQALGPRVRDYVLRVTLLENPALKHASPLQLDDITAAWSALE